MNMMPRATERLEKKEVLGGEAWFEKVLEQMEAGSRMLDRSIRAWVSNTRTAFAARVRVVKTAGG